MNVNFTKKKSVVLSVIDSRRNSNHEQTHLPFSPKAHKKRRRHRKKPTSANILLLPHDLPVILGHLEEVRNGHLALVAILALANGYDIFCHFLFADDEQVRHLLEFALADLVAELLTPLASMAAAHQ